MALGNDFAEERERFDLWRPHLGDDVCLFVPNHEYGLMGFVTFGVDAQRLAQAIANQPEPDYVAYDDMLWVPDASDTRKRRIETICGCTLVFQVEPPSESPPHGSTPR